MNRFVEPQEVAATVCCLASEGCSLATERCSISPQRPRSHDRSRSQTAEPRALWPGNFSSAASSGLAVADGPFYNQSLARV